MPITTLTRQSRTAGDHDTASIQAASGENATRFDGDLDLSDLQNPSLTFTMEIWESTDGGTSWVVSRMQDQGRPGRTSQPFFVIRDGVQVNQAWNRRHVRGRIVLSRTATVGGTLSTGAS